jgi:hypothetical protein
MSQNANMSAGSTAAPSPKDGLFFLTILMNMRNKPEVSWLFHLYPMPSQILALASSITFQLKTSLSLLKYRVLTELTLAG